MSSVNYDTCTLTTVRRVYLSFKHDSSVLLCKLGKLFGMCIRICRDCNSVRFTVALWRHTVLSKHFNHLNTAEINVVSSLR